MEARLGLAPKCSSPLLSGHVILRYEPFDLRDQDAVEETP